MTANGYEFLFEVMLQCPKEIYWNSVPHCVLNGSLSPSLLHSYNAKCQGTV